MAYTVPDDVDQRPVAIDGAGTLGRRIATVYAAGASDLRIFDLSEQQLAAAGDHVTAHVGDTAQKLGLLGDRPGRVEIYDDLQAAVAGAWMVVQAVAVDVALTTEVLGQLDRV